MKTVYLVSCVKSKLDAPAAAQDLYTSLWFRTARGFVEGKHSPWYVLSARHGLVSPEQILAPYEVTLNRMKAAKRRLWAKTTAEQIIGQIEPQHVTFLAGKNYREYLIPLLETEGYTWDAPLARFGIGSQVSFMQRERQ